MSAYTLALSGHRELPEGFDINALHDTLEELIKEGCTHVCCGMARGFDLLALECLIDLKRRYHVCVEACIPHRGQADKFPQFDKMRYECLLSRCDVKTVLSEKYHSGCMLARNRYMVDKSDVLLAYCTRSSGGTAYTVDYAKRAGLHVILLKG